MLELRPYQRQAVDALYQYWQTEEGSPLIVLPTGGGKSLVIATIIQELLTNYPDMRILNATHQKELIESNYMELIKLWQFAPAGIFSASVGRREARAQVIFGGVQTIANKMDLIGHIDLVMVDEAHLMPRKSETQYGQLLAGARAINPDLHLVGLTATPFRLGEGLLTDGEDALFDAVCYEKPIGEMIEEGFLSRPISKGMTTGYNLDGVGKLGGDYKQNSLAAAVDKDDVNAAVVDEIMAYGKDRGSWLLFCSGVDHALHMRDEIRSRGVSCETITGSTPQGERTKILEDFKSGHVRAVTNNSVMTTGVNVPRIDLIAFCRPTLSESLYLQMAGRGLRLFPGKQNCLFLDFAGVVRKHGPIDSVTVSGPRGKGEGDAPIRICPECESINHAAARVCVDCGHEFPEPELKVVAVAEDLPVLSTSTTWRTVTSRPRYTEHPGKAGKPNSVKVSYTCGFLNVNSWLCPAHTGFAKVKSEHYWRDHGGQKPFPDSVEAWLLRQHELADTAEIEIEYNGKWPNAKNYRAAAANDNLEVREATNDNRTTEDVLDDFIPF